MKYEDIAVGEFFAVDDKTEFPKIKLEEGYYDLHFGVKNLAVNESWKFEVLTEEQVKQILGKKFDDTDLEFRLSKAKNMV